MTSLVLILVLEVSAIQVKSNLLEFANVAANTNKTQILISGDINPNDFYFFTDRASVNVTIPLFKKMVELQGLRFLKMDDFYFIDDPKKKKRDSEGNFTGRFDEEPENLYYIKMQGNSFAELNAMLNQYDKNATYIAQDNAAVIKATEKQYSEILSYLPNFDNKTVEQIRFKITILETDLSDLRKRGTEVNSLLKAVDNKDFSFLFDKNSKAEVPVFGKIGDDIISGQIDRLSIVDDVVYLVDYKNTNVLPKYVPQKYVKQLELYKKVLEKIYLDKIIKTYILWTSFGKIEEVEVN